VRHGAEERHCGSAAEGARPLAAGSPRPCLAHRCLEGRAPAGQPNSFLANQAAVRDDDYDGRSGVGCLGCCTQCSSRDRGGNIEWPASTLPTARSGGTWKNAKRATPRRLRRSVPGLASALDVGSGQIRYRAGIPGRCPQRANRCPKSGTLRRTENSHGGAAHKRNHGWRFRSLGRVAASHCLCSECRRACLWSGIPCPPTP
jgi:hypothetical protein